MGYIGTLPAEPCCDARPPIVAVICCTAWHRRSKGLDKNKQSTLMASRLANLVVLTITITSDRTNYDSLLFRLKKCVPLKAVGTEIGARSYILLSGVKH